MSAAPLFGLDPASLTSYLPLAVGLGVAVVGGITVVVMARRTRPPADAPAGQAVDADGNPSQTHVWEEHRDRATVADRRGSVRREGAPVKVYATSPALRGQVHEGWVLDRSTGGLRLALASALPPGSFLQVRAENAPDTIPWVSLVIRSCKDVGDHFELGCSFEQTPPWNVLLLFG